MLYAILKPIITVSLRAYFKRIDVVGKEHLETDGALFVCNHPSALFDPIMVASNTKNPIYFLAGAEWFGKGVQKWFFEHQFNMIPVYRPWLAEGKEEAKQKNEEMFSACYDSLKAGKRIIIFPEASSITVPWLRDIKTGASRIKLGAQQTNGQDVKIIPIGINYANSHRFQTRVLVKVGVPIDFSDLEAQEEDPKELVRKMTERIHDCMSELLYYKEGTQQFELIKDLKKLMTGVLENELGLAKSDPAAEFEIRKSLVNEIERISKNNPEKVSEVAKRLRSYISEFESLGFRKYNPFEDSASSIAMKSVALLIGLPVFALGALYNLLPFLATQAIYKRFFLPRVAKKDAQGQLNSAFAGSLGFSAGLVIFLIWYIALWLIGGYWLPLWISFLITIAAGYITGRFAMVYYKWLVQIRKFISWQLIASKDPEIIADLLKRRTTLIDDLMQLRLNNA